MLVKRGDVDPVHEFIGKKLTADVRAAIEDKFINDYHIEFLPAGCPVEGIKLEDRIIVRVNPHTDEIMSGELV